MTSFYPGPSQVYAKVPQWVQMAYDEGMLSANHRSPMFQDMVKEVYSLLREKLNIPEDYDIVFTSSATECWEIIAQSFVTEKTYHLYNGAFGEKWYRYTKPLVPTVVGYQFDYRHPLDLDQIIVPDDVEVLCLTQNETSNGTQISNATLRAIRVHYPDYLIAVDATSSMAGVALDFTTADIWYASVQKCFGLPAGMGIMITSPSATERALEIQERDHYNSWAFMHENAKNFQTHYTPNVMGIYLLYQSLKERDAIDKVDAKLRKRASNWIEFLEQLPQLNLLVESDEARSYTVLTLEGEPNVIKTLHKRAQEAGYTMGKGYGDWKKTTLRIANFPAIKKDAIVGLQQALMGQ